MFEIKCRDLTGEDCDFVAKGETGEEAKSVFYRHGADSPIHREAYETATSEQKDTFGKKVDEHIASQG